MGRENLVPGKVYVLFGKPGFFNGKAQMAHPEMEPYNPGTPTAWRAYPATRLQLYQKAEQFTLDSKGLQKLITALLDQFTRDIHENLPAYLLNRFKLAPRADSYRNIHFPDNAAQLNEAIHRLKFEELFFLQLKLLKNKLTRTSKFKGNILER
jgi:ATP-dependent DNA helicase RecG